MVVIRTLIGWTVDLPNHIGATSWSRFVVEKHGGLRMMDETRPPITHEHCLSSFKTVVMESGAIPVIILGPPTRKSSDMLMIGFRSELRGSEYCSSSQ